MNKFEIITEPNGTTHIYQDCTEIKGVREYEVKKGVDCLHEVVLHFQSPEVVIGKMFGSEK